MPNFSQIGSTVAELWSGAFCDGVVNVLSVLKGRTDDVALAETPKF